MTSGSAAAADAGPQPAAFAYEEPASAAPAIRLGPLQFGMSLDQIQAAIPAARWEITSRSRFTDRAFNIVATDALEYGGWRMKVEARDEKYDRNLVLTSRTTVPGAQACEQAGLRLFETLEASAGRLQANRDPYGESMSFGNGSTALFTAFDARSRPVARKHMARGKVERMGLIAKREGERLEVKGLVGFDARKADNCYADVTIIGWRAQPPPEVMPYDEAKVVRRMSIGDRHRLASTLVFTTDAVTVPKQCQVSRQTGAVLTCQASDGSSVGSEIAAVAIRYAGAMAFDLSGLDRDDPQPVLVEIPVRVARTDVRPLTFSGPQVRMSAVEFDAAPPPQEIQRAFPYRALQGGIGAEVEAVCEVQSDGSLVCRPPTVRQTDGASSFVTAFEQAVEKLLASYRVGPALKNGAPSAGTVFGMGVSFKVAE